MNRSRELIEMPYGLPQLADAGAPDRQGELTLAAAVLAFASGVVHLALIVPHLRESLALAALFSLAGIAEIAWAVAFVRTRDRVLRAVGAILMLSVVVGWTASRTVGLPLGIDPGPPESFGLLDCLTSGCELFALYALLQLRKPASARGVACAGLMLAVLLLLSLATLGHHAIG